MHINGTSLYKIAFQEGPVDFPRSQSSHSLKAALSFVVLRHKKIFLGLVEDVRRSATARTRGKV